MYSHMTGQLDALNLDVSELIWNEGKLHRAPVLGELYTSDKQKSTIYRPRRHRRERTQEWALELLREMLPEKYVDGWCTVREAILENRYARRVRRAAERNAQLLREIEALPVKERLAGMALYHSTSEGVLHPERSEAGELVFAMPDFIKSGAVKVPRPFPLPPGADTVEPSVQDAVQELRTLLETELPIDDGSDLSEEEDDSDVEDAEGVDEDCSARRNVRRGRYDSSSSEEGDSGEENSALLAT